jgi:hypothetical protein
MAQHVTGWADLTRKLKLWGVPLTTMPTLESMLFLRTLPKKYNDFINHKELRKEMTSTGRRIYTSQRRHGVQVPTVDAATKPTRTARRSSVGATAVRLFPIKGVPSKMPASARRTPATTATKSATTSPSARRSAASADAKVTRKSTATLALTPTELLCKSPRVVAKARVENSLSSLHRKSSSSLRLRSSFVLHPHGPPVHGWGPSPRPLL